MLDHFPRMYLEKMDVRCVPSVRLDVNLRNDLPKTRKTIQRRVGDKGIVAVA